MKDLNEQEYINTLNEYIDRTKKATALIDSQLEKLSDDIKLGAVDLLTLYERARFYMQMLEVRMSHDADELYRQMGFIEAERRMEEAHANKG